jgi:RNA polymerase sigma-70 factor (ECF subfamily)
MSSSVTRHFPEIFRATKSDSARSPGPKPATAEGEQGSSSPQAAANAQDVWTSPTTLSDEALMARVCEGDKEGLALLFGRYARIVRGVAYRVLRDVSEADDLLQDIFVLIHRLCGTFDSSKGSARHWILQMTQRRAISRRRYLTSRHFYNRVDLDETAGWLQYPMTRAQRHADSIGEALEKKETLQSWFEQLSPNQRETLRLFFFEGYNFDEIAARLGQTTVNARQYYYRGLDRLRKRIFAGKLPKGEALW